MCPSLFQEEAGDHTERNQETLEVHILAGLGIGLGPPYTLLYLHKPALDS